MVLVSHKLLRSDSELFRPTAAHNSVKCAVVIEFVDQHTCTSSTAAYCAGSLIVGEL